MEYLFGFAIFNIVEKLFKQNHLAINRYSGDLN
jgi:hypothetical protein